VLPLGSSFSLCDSKWAGNLLSTTVNNLHLLHWPVSAISLVVLYLPDHAHALDNLAEDNMLSIQPGGFDGGDEKLRTIGVLASISHGQPASSIVRKFEVLVSKPRNLQLFKILLTLNVSLLFSIDGPTTSSISSCEVSPLKHEVLDDSVELASLVTLSLGLLSKLDKVLHSFRYNIPKQSNLNPLGSATSNGDVEPDLVSNNWTICLSRATLAAGDENNQPQDEPNTASHLNQRDL
jgi:hypothetical protein